MRFCNNIPGDTTAEKHFSQNVFDDTPRPWLRESLIADLPAELPVTLHRVAKETHPSPSQDCRLWWVCLLDDADTLAEPWSVPQTAVLPTIKPGRPSVRVWRDRELARIGRRSEPLLAATLRQRAGLATLADEALLCSEQIAKLVGRFFDGVISEREALRALRSCANTQRPAMKGTREALAIRIGLFSRGLAK